MQHLDFQFADRTLAELADIAGPAPTYVYSRATISKKIEQTRLALPDAIKLHYSIKANPHPLTVAHIGNQVDGMDVASQAEMQLALGSGLSADRISFSGPGKNDVAIISAITANIVLHAESIGEIKRISAIAKRLNKRPNIALRINPDFTVKQSGMVMGGGSQPFGIDLEQVGEALHLMKQNGLSCIGLHCYAGSQMLNAALVSELQEKTVNMMLDVVEQHSLENVSFNIGGGFGIPYVSHAKALDIQLVGNKLDELLNRTFKNTRVSEIIIELGRYLVAESGIYLARIIERKHSRGKNFLVVEGGMNHHLAASGNLGQTIRRNYPVVGGRVSGQTTQRDTVETVSIVGPLCTPLDILAADVQLPRLAPGDHIAILNSGAYGYSASPQGFLSHPSPNELLL